MQQIVKILRGKGTLWFYEELSWQRCIANEKCFQSKFGGNLETLMFRFPEIEFPNFRKHENPDFSDFLILAKS